MSWLPKDKRARPAIDLHAHSTASDGLLSPTELVKEAARVGLRGLALTDHDTAAGVAEATVAAEGLGVELVPGVEFGVAAPWSPPDEPREIHGLGYYFRPEHPAIVAATERMRRSREDRAPRMVEKLAGLGISLSLDEIRAASGGTVLGRPHVARALVARGAVPDTNAAFDRYIATGRPAYVARDLLEVDVAFAAIRDAGGLPVLAHPWFYFRTIDEMCGQLVPLRDQGLVGLECGHPGHPKGLPRRLADVAKRLGLLVTAGSDYHGPGHKEGTALGYAAPHRPIPGELLDRLRERSKAR